MDTNINQCSKDILSDDPDQQLRATQQLRRLLSIEVSPPIQQVIECGAVPRLVAFLSRDDMPSLQFEAAWCLTNITSGTSAQTKAVMDAGKI
jgi:importin subunit alpha-1